MGKVQKSALRDHVSRHLYNRSYSATGRSSLDRYDHRRQSRRGTLRARIAARTAELARQSIVPGSPSCWSATIRPARSTSAARPSKRPPRVCDISIIACPPARARPQLISLVAEAESRKPTFTASWCNCRCRPAWTAPRCWPRSIPAKDVDGFHAVNAGRLAPGQDATVPCTPLGCLILIRRSNAGPGRQARRGHRALEHRRQTDGAAAVTKRLYGDDRSLAHSRPAATVSRGGDPGGGYRPTQGDRRRLDPSGRDRHRRRHQPHRGADGQTNWWATSITRPRWRMPERSRRCRAALAR